MVSDIFIGIITAAITALILYWFFLRKLPENTEKLVQNRLEHYTGKSGNLANEHSNLSREHSNLSKEHSNLSKEHSNLSKEHDEIINYYLKDLRDDMLMKKQLSSGENTGLYLAAIQNDLFDKINQNKKLKQENKELKSELRNSSEINKVLNYKTKQTRQQKKEEELSL